MALWDHIAVTLGVWGWTPQQTWGIRLWLIPLEEYLFALLETLLLTMLMYAIGLWLYKKQYKGSKQNT
jgi:lycopene cyclase domain-containing protein